MVVFGLLNGGFLVDALVGHLMQVAVFVHSKEDDMRKFSPDFMQDRVFGLRHTGDDVVGLVVPDIIDDGLKSILCIDDIHHGTVLVGDIKQILNGLGVRGVFVALHIQNNEVGLGNVGNAFAGLNQSLALKLIRYQDSSTFKGCG